MEPERIARRLELAMCACILIIDDVEDNRLALHDALDGEGYEIHHVADGEQAWRAVEEHPPDVILLDVLMPGIDGIELCRRWKTDERTRRIPVILVTGLSADEHVVRGLDVGATDYISKPFRGAVVRARVAAAARSKCTSDLLQESLLRVTDLVEALEARNDTLEQMAVTAHTFLDHVAHEFRAPLASVIAYCDVLGEDLAGSLSPPRQAAVEQIDHAARDLLQRVDDRLDTSRMEAGRLRFARGPCTAAALWEVTRRRLERHVSRRRAVVRADVQPGLPAVWIDAPTAGRGLANLLISMLDAGSEGMLIEVTMSPATDGAVAITIATEAPAACLESVVEPRDASAELARRLLKANLAAIRPLAVAGGRVAFQFDLPGCGGVAIVRRFLRLLREPEIEATGVAIIEARLAAPAEVARAIAPVMRPFELVLPCPDGAVLLIGPTRRPGVWMRRLGAAAEGLDLTVQGAWGLDEAASVTALIARRLGPSSWATAA